MRDCVFCEPERIANPIEWHEVQSELTIMVFEPLEPVTPGHLLVVPTVHVDQAVHDPWVAGIVAEIAATVAGRYDSSNIITSIGTPATQTVEHLHWHVVPRTEGDGLVLPWSPSLVADSQ